MPAVIPVVVEFLYDAIDLVEAYGALATGLSTAVIGSALEYAAVIGGALAYSSYERRKLAGTGTVGAPTMSQSSDYPRTLVYGQARVSGPIAFLTTTGSNNEYIHIILPIAGCELTSIDNIYFGSDLLSLDGSGNITGCTDINGNASTKYNGLGLIHAYLGAPSQTADATLIAAAPTLWTTAHKLNGIAYLYVQLKFDSSTYGGGIPNITADVHGMAIYDPRTSTTAYSNNAALCIADYLNQPILGLDTPYNPDVDAAELNNSANICDEPILLADGITTIPRYRINGVVASDGTPESILNNLCSAMAGTVVYSSGTWFIQAGAWRTPQLTFTEADLIGPISTAPRLSKRDGCNSTKGTYFEPTENWADTDFTPYQDPTYIAEDNGQVIWHDLQLAYTTDNPTCNRLAKIDTERARREMQVSISTNLKGLQVRAGDSIYLTFARYGWSAKEFEVLEWSFKTTGGGKDNIPLPSVSMSLREIDSGVFDWSNGEEGTHTFAGNTTLPNPFNVAPITGLGVSSSFLLTPDGIVSPTLTVSWTAPADAFVQSGGQVEIQYRPHGTSPWLIWKVVPGSFTSDMLTNVLTGNYYDVRVQPVNNIGAAGAWVELDNNLVSPPTTPPAIPSGVVASSGPELVALTWTLSTDSSIKYYKIWRSTSPIGTGAVFLEQAWSTQYKDTSGTVGTTYYYAISAVNNSNVESAISAWSNGAAPGVAGPNTTAPSAPSAASAADAGGTYLATDGAVYGYLDISVPAMPAGAAWQQLEVQKTSSSGFVMFAYLTNTGAQTVTIPDLSPGLVVAIQTVAYNSDGVPSSATAATGSPFTVPSKSSAPSAPGSGGLTINGVKPLLWNGIGPYMVGTAAYWTAISDLDLAYYEIKGTSTDSDSATDYSGFFNNQGAGGIQATSELTGCWYQGGPSTFTAIYIRVRGSDNSGNKSAWLRLGELFANGNTGIGSISTQSQTNPQITGTQTGALGAGSVPFVNANAPFPYVHTMTGGAATEQFYVSIAGMGFTAKPTNGLVAVQTPNTGYTAVYDYDDPSNSSTQASIVVTAKSGTIPAGGMRFSITLNQ